MILPDHRIKERVEDDVIVVRPKPDEEQYQPASLDLRLGDEVYSFHEDETHSYGEEDDNKVTLLPRRRYLATTREWVNVPRSLAAQLAGRSTVGRKGIIIHKTAGFVDPGFQGQLTLELMNLGNQAQTLRVGQRVGQLVFFRLTHTSNGYEGHYQHQEGPTKAHDT